jgi:hypothetical protein
VRQSGPRSHGRRRGDGEQQQVADQLQQRGRRRQAGELPAQLGQGSAPRPPTALGHEGQ